MHLKSQSKNERNPFNYDSNKGTASTCHAGYLIGKSRCLSQLRPLQAEGGLELHLQHPNSKSSSNNTNQSSADLQAPSGTIILIDRSGSGGGVPLGSIVARGMVILVVVVVAMPMVPMSFTIDTIGRGWGRWSNGGGRWSSGGRGRVVILIIVTVPVITVGFAVLAVGWRWG